MKKQTKKQTTKKASATWVEPKAKQKTKIAELTISFFDDGSFIEALKKFSDTPILSTTIIGAVEVINIRRAIETINNKS